MQGFGAWILQRISAVILIVLVAVHFGIMHFVDPTAEITFAATSLRFKSALYFLVDAGLLVIGLFHGLNGIRNILLDYFPRSGRAIGMGACLVGIVFTGYGATALYAFLTIK